MASKQKPLFSKLIAPEVSEVTRRPDLKRGAYASFRHARWLTGTFEAVIGLQAGRAGETFEYDAAENENAGRRRFAGRRSSGGRRNLQKVRQADRGERARSTAADTRLRGLPDAENAYATQGGNFLSDCSIGGRRR